MDPSTTSVPFILNRENGTALEFPILSPSERVKYRNAFRLFRKLQLFTNEQIVGTPAAEALAKLNQFDKQRLSESDVERWVLDPEGQVAAIMLCLQQHKSTADEKDVDALRLDDDQMLTVAAAVLRIPLTYSKSGGEKKPDPTTGETAGTGSASPTESDAT